VGHSSINIDILHSEKKGKEKGKHRKDKTLA
jgi:hypothetical protein